MYVFISKLLQNAKRFDFLRFRWIRNLLFIFLRLYQYVHEWNRIKSPHVFFGPFH